MISLEPIKSICKIIFDHPPKELSSGFLIQLHKDEQPFYCLMTNEHSIDKEMIKGRQKMNLYYDNHREFRKIQLNSEERFIKDFRDIKIDITVVEILPKDNIHKDYFLLPLIDYMDNYDKLIGQDIIIMQYPEGDFNLTEGKLEHLTKATLLRTLQ